MINATEITPPSASDPDGSSTNGSHLTRGDFLGIACSLILGVFLVFHAQILSGLSKGLGSPHDPRLVTYLLEHATGCLDSARLAECLVNPPFFYPARGVTFHSETFWGLVPFYAFVRVVVSDPARAYTLWSMLLAAANFLAAWILLRRELELGRLPSLAAAFLFAFGSPRAAILTQSFTFAQFPFLLALVALSREMRQVVDGGDRRRYIVLFWLALAWQAHSFIYSAFFGAFLLFFAAATALAIRRYRRVLLESMRSRCVSWAVSGLLGLLLVVPLVLGYSHSLVELRGARWDWVEPRLPHWLSFLYQGPRSLLWSQLERWAPLAATPAKGWHQLGLGPVTTVLALIGLVRLRRRAWFPLVAAPAVLLFVICFRFPGGFSPWVMLFDQLPGAPAFRFVNRAYQLLLIVPAAGWGVAMFDLAKGKRPGFVWAALTAVCLLEQVQLGWGYSLPNRARLEQAIAYAIPETCESFFYSPLGETAPLVSQLDAMWAGLLIQRPTINGFSGYRPPGWNLRRHAISSKEDERRIRASLEDWLSRNNLARTCWVQFDTALELPHRIEVVESDAAP